MLKKNRNIAIISGIVALLVLSIIFYFNYNMNLLREDYGLKLTKLAEGTNSKLNELQNSISKLGSNLSSQIGVVDINLENFKKQNKKEIATLDNNHEK